MQLFQITNQFCSRLFTAMFTPETFCSRVHTPYSVNSEQNRQNPYGVRARACSRLPKKRGRREQDFWVVCSRLFTAMFTQKRLKTSLRLSLDIIINGRTK